jgi:hypothetical protein
MGLGDYSGGQLDPASARAIVVSAASIEGLQARDGQAGRVADVVQPGGGFEQIGVSPENRGQAACPGGHALDVCPATGKVILEEYPGELPGP